MMKDIIQDRLNRVTDLNERRILKSILNDVYSNVVDYNMDMYDKLEQRIFSEIEDPLDKFYIYSSMDYIENIDPIDDFLYPMCQDDLENTYNMAEINTKLQTGEKITLTSVFMDCDNPTLKAMLSDNKAYKGYVKTDKDNYEVDITLKRCEKYIKEIEKLYRVFQANNVEWRTLNCPYAYRFVDIILESELTIKEEEKVIEININLGEYDQYKQINTIPLWNVKYTQTETKSFPEPAKDTINYNHPIPVKDLGIQNGYLAGLDNKDYMYCKRTEEELIIISNIGEPKYWNIVQVKNRVNAKQKKYTYELLSNTRNLGFIGRYASVKSLVIRTQGEIARILHSYELSKELIFQRVEIKESYDKPIKTIDFNEFIDDNIRSDSYKKILLITFKAAATANKESLLIYDKMSFLVSEIQFLFPEYRCIGELIKEETMKELI